MGHSPLSRLGDEMGAPTFYHSTYPRLAPAASLSPLAPQARCGVGFEESTQMQGKKWIPCSK